MSVGAVVRKDFRDGIRSKLLWLLIAFFVLSIGGFTYLATGSTGQDASGQDVQLLGILGIAAIFAVIFLVPITGLVVSIKSIVRERELGSIKILLSLPQNRYEVVVGKFIGRSGLLTAAILAGFVPAGLLLFVRTGELPVFEYSMFVLVTILFGVVFVAVGIGLSALVNTETQGTVAGVGAFFVLFFWDTLFNFVNGQLDLLSGNAADFASRLYLFNVFFDALFTLLSLQSGDLPSGSIVTWTEASFAEPGAATIPAQPFYLQNWFAFVILALWIAVPLVVGYYLFSRKDV